MFLLSLSGCGYKDAPFYTPDAPKSDKNVDFVIKKQNLVPVKDSNESCNEN